MCLGYITTKIGCIGLNFVAKSSYIQLINDIARYEHSGVILIHNISVYVGRFGNVKEKNHLHNDVVESLY